MITFIVVSHSYKISEGIVDLVNQMVSNSNLHIIPVGGTVDHEIGTNPLYLQKCIENSSDSERIYLFGDIGSSIMSIEMVLDMIDASLRIKCFYLDAPIVEGTFVAAIQTLVNSSHESILSEVSKLIK